VTLPPTIDEAIRLIRSQHGRITVGELADAVLDRGWDVDRTELVQRIRQLYPSKAGRPATSDAAEKDRQQRRTGSAVRRAKPKGVTLKQSRRKPKKSKARQVYCPRCQVFVVITAVDGVWTFAQHLTKKGRQCQQGGKTYVKPPKRDAMDFRVPGSFGGGKRR